MKDNKIVLPPDVDGGVSITPPQGCEVDKVEVIDGVLNVTFKPQERKLPKSWEEFCEMFPVKPPEVFIREGGIYKVFCEAERDTSEDIATFPDYATAEAVLALCKLIQLRNCYNGDWVPDWNKGWFKGHRISVITIHGEFEVQDKINIETSYAANTPHLLYFKDKSTADEFLRNFRPLIEKIKPLYGIKEGGEE